MNELTVKGKIKDSFPIDKFLSLNISECTKLANLINDYFANVGENLAKRLDSGGNLVINDENYKCNNFMELGFVFVTRGANTKIWL